MMYSLPFISRYLFRRCYSLRWIWFFVCLLFLSVQYLTMRLFQWQSVSSSVSTRLYPNQPITLDLRPFSVCHPAEFQRERLTNIYHQTFDNQSWRQPCFLVEDLDGGSWWSYVSTEFAEILTELKRLGLQSNMDYRSFPPKVSFNAQTNLHRYFLNACDMNENLTRDEQPKLIVALIWNINRLVWYQLRQQLNELFQTTRIRLLVFIDDLHFPSKKVFQSRQFLFQSYASEIFSTYPYLFHNYYVNISSNLLTWVPHAASIQSIRSINQTAENILFVSGAHLSDWYPCRSRAFLLCQMRIGLARCLRHPGYGDIMRNSSDFYYGGQRYSIYMKQFTYGLATCQSVQYAIAKLFEIPANGLVLVTTHDMVPVLNRLGLREKEHFLTVDCSSFARLNLEIRRLQKLSSESIFPLRQRSQDQIFERHLTSHRAELLHVRLLSHALIESSTSERERHKFDRWGRNCS